MKINKGTLEEIAHLSRIEIKEQEKDELMKDLSKVLTWMEKLNELNTDGVDEEKVTFKVENKLRDDKKIQNISREDILKNAPQKDSEFFRVPKIIE